MRAPRVQGLLSCRVTSWPQFAPLDMPTLDRIAALLPLDLLTRDPYAANTKIKPLKGRPGFRLRVGSWRVIYELDRGRIVILVLDIGPRGSIYE